METMGKFKKWLNCVLGNHIYKAQTWDDHIAYICQNCDYSRIVHYHSYGYSDDRKIAGDNHQLYDSQLKRTGKYFNS